MGPTWGRQEIWAAAFHTQNMQEYSQFIKLGFVFVGRSFINGFTWVIKLPILFRVASLTQDKRLSYCHRSHNEEPILSKLVLRTADHVPRLRHSTHSRANDNELIKDVCSLHCFMVFVQCGMHQVKGTFYHFNHGIIISLQMLLCWPKIIKTASSCKFYRNTGIFT